MKRVLRGPSFLQTTFDEPFSSTKGQRQMVLGRTSALQEEPFFSKSDRRMESETRREHKKRRRDGEK